MIRAALLTSLLVAGPALAAPSIDVTVRVILASNEGNHVDPSLEPLQRQLSGFAFKSYKLLSTRQLSLAAGEKGEVALPAKRTLEVTPAGRDRQGKLRVRVRIEGLIDTTYTIAGGGTLIIGGPSHGSGKLVLAITQSASGK